MKFLWEKKHSQRTWQFEQNSLRPVRGNWKNPETSVIFAEIEKSSRTPTALIANIDFFNTFYESRQNGKVLLQAVTHTMRKTEEHKPRSTPTKSPGNKRFKKIKTSSFLSIQRHNFFLSVKVIALSTNHLTSHLIISYHIISYDYVKMGARVRMHAYECIGMHRNA